MRTAITVGVAASIVATGLVSASSRQEVPLEGMTPIITVESIEPCLPFWTESLSFEVTASVPGADGLAFAMLQSGGVELMLQTRASIDSDLGASGAPAGLSRELVESTTTLFVQVSELDPLVARIGAAVDVVVPRRQTDYGMDEIFLRAPCGTLVGLAAPVEPGA